MSIPADADFAAYLAIQNALATYVIAVDTREVALFDRCFFPDAVITLAATGTYDPEAYKKLVLGSAEILDATQHHLGLPALRIEGDRAWSRTYFVAQHTRNEKLPRPHLTIGGWYDDELARRDGRWAILRRTGTGVWYDGNPDLLGYAFPMGAVPRGPGHAAPAWLAG